MAETLRKGQLDGFCVGAPWNSVAVAAGAGIILHQGTDIVRDCPEKVLAFRTEWARSHKEEVGALVEAIGGASRWASSPSNRNALVTLLTATAGQDVPAATIERILGYPASPSASPLVATGLRLDEEAIKASPIQALWLYAQMVAAGQITYSDAFAEAAAAVYEPDSSGPPIPRPRRHARRLRHSRVFRKRHPLLPRVAKSHGAERLNFMRCTISVRRGQRLGRLRNG